jgi:hypothetical protein
MWWSTHAKRLGGIQTRPEIVGEGHRTVCEWRRSKSVARQHDGRAADNARPSFYVADEVRASPVCDQRIASNVVRIYVRKSRRRRLISPAPGPLGPDRQRGPMLGFLSACHACGIAGALRGLALIVPRHDHLQGTPRHAQRQPHAVVARMPELYPGPSHKSTRSSSRSATTGFSFSNTMTFVRVNFDVPRPVLPVSSRADFAGDDAAFAESLEAATATYRAALAQWRASQNAHEEAEDEREFQYQKELQAIQRDADKRAQEPRKEVSAAKVSMPPHFDRRRLDVAW